jgi:hypothetical protein
LTKQTKNSYRKLWGKHKFAKYQKRKGDIQTTPSKDFVASSVKTKSSQADEYVGISNSPFEIV